MSKDGWTVAGVKLSGKAATRATFADLHSWVIWQFPRPLKDGLCGAVRPPEDVNGWYPAVVYPGDELVRIYAHLAADSFETPEAAADFLHQTSKKGG